MDEDPTWGELLVGLVLILGVPTALVGVVIFGVVGVVFWVTAPERPWRRGAARSWLRRGVFRRGGDR
ncbi:hypothetical protein GCM10022244_58440 [Streptomyces gulbargensis]|uniref:Uncharacterized protein n=1 Tax=Streptomyces gulbargensis TaxID=364901 RepID=A0ABP7NCR0_9ACTN